MKSENYFKNYGEIVSSSDVAIVARTHAKVPYSSTGLMVVHFELVRLKKMSMTDCQIKELRNYRVASG